MGRMREWFARLSHAERKDVLVIVGLAAVAAAAVATSGIPTA